MGVLDTNFLIDLDNNRPAALSKAREIERTGKPRRVPWIVIEYERRVLAYPFVGLERESTLNATLFRAW